MFQITLNIRQKQSLSASINTSFISMHYAFHFISFFRLSRELINISILWRTISTMCNHWPTFMSYTFFDSNKKWFDFSTEINISNVILFSQLFMFYYWWKKFCKTCGNSVKFVEVFNVEINIDNMYTIPKCVYAFSK